jgi:indole-3-glycerol phosphate synthase
MSGAGPDLLEAIVAAARTRTAVARSRVPAAALERHIATLGPCRGFRMSLDQPGVRVIAECKRRSPSRGVLRALYDPVAIARRYAQAGAAAVSVLTEPTFFDGELAHLTAVHAAVGIPVLRKDFIVDRYQLLEARAAGADAVLLIVASLDQAMLSELHTEAQGLGLDALVEVHDQRELDRANDAGADLVGVNNRNLRTLTVDVEASLRLAARMPAAVLAVAESGLRTHADLVRLAGVGYRGFLVGEQLMTATDPGAALAALLAPGAAA